jgi:hypothetical protein
MTTNISNLLSNAVVPVDMDFEKILPTPVKVGSDKVPAEIRWAEKQQEKHIKRVQIREKITLTKEINSLFAAATANAKPKTEKKGKATPDAKKSGNVEAKIEAKPSEVKSDEFHQSAILGRNILGLIDHKMFLLLINDLRSLTSTENEVQHKNPLALKRIAEFCKLIDFPLEKFDSLNRTQRSCLVLDAYTGFKPNVAPGLQITLATDKACNAINVKQRIDYVTRLQLIKASLDKSTYTPGENDVEAKQILNFAGRVNSAIEEITNLIVKVTEPDYVRDMEVFTKAALVMVSWISSEKVLNFYRKRIESTGYKFISNDADAYIAVCKQVGFNISQASRILQAVEDTVLASKEEVHNFVSELLELDRANLVNPTPTYVTKLGEAFKDKFSQIQVS